MAATKKNYILVLETLHKRKFVPVGILDTVLKGERIGVPYKLLDETWRIRKYVPQE